MIGTPEQDAFVRSNKWAVVTTLRADGSPTNSVIFYALDGDTILFSTTSDRLKARTIRDDPRVAITVLDEGKPFGYVTLEGNASLQHDDIVPGHVAINKAMRGGDFTPPDDYADRLAAQERLLVRLTPTRVHGVTNRR